MSPSSIITGPDGEFMSLEDFLDKALVKGLENTFKSGLIELLPSDKTKYKNFIQSGIWAAYNCKDMQKKEVRLDGEKLLTLKVIIEDKEVQTIILSKTADNQVTLKYFFSYQLGPAAINDCEDMYASGEDIKETLENSWERYLIFKTGELEYESKNTQKPQDINKNIEKITEIIKKLKE